MDENDLDSYVQVFMEGQDRGYAPVSTRTSERDINVPFPVLPGYLQGVTAAAPRSVNPTALAPKQRAAYVAAVRARAVAARAPAPMMLTTSAPAAKSFPAAQAAGGSLPSPSPAMGASSPPPPDATTLLPMPSPPSFPSAITTNVAPGSCPPCSCPGGISTGSILALLAAAGFASYLLTQRGK